MRTLMVQAALGAAALVFSACGPSLNPHTRDARTYTSTERCSQGPLDLHARAAGARWGEQIEVYACSPRNIQGRYAIAVDGNERESSRFGDYGERIYQTPDAQGNPRTHQQVAIDHPDNERCVASESELASVGRATTESSASEPASSGGEIAPAPAAATTSVDAQRIRRVAANETVPDCATMLRVPITTVSWEAYGEDDPAPLRAGADIRIRLWSEVPNDLEGVFFFFRHSVLRPSVSDREWVEHLREERREAEEDSREAQREAQEDADEQQRDQREHVAYCQTHPRDRDRCRHEFCAAHHEDEQCWGRGGYEGHQARVEARSRRARAEGEAQSRRAHAEDEARRRATPSGPPPAARAETRPPTPSQNADWVPGYWVWSASAAGWGWIGGRWRVPETDIQAGLTTHAPAAPPAAQAESRPAAPGANATWTPGYWQWDGRAYVWVAGSWQIAPSARHTWRAATWESRGHGVVLVPGGWVVSIGR